MIKKMKIEESVKKAFDEAVGNNQNYIKEQEDKKEKTEDNDATPEDIRNGNLKFDFYFKEGSKDGMVYFDVSFKRGREYTKLEDNNFKNAGSVLKQLNAVGYLLDRDDWEPFYCWLKIQLKNEDNFIKKHCNIGWDSIKTEDEKVEQEIRLNDIYTIDGSLGSEYCGELKNKLSKSGNLESYIKGLKDLVIGNSKLETALITGFSGFITQALDIEQEDDYNIVLNYTGKTSSGKTTTSKLAVTPFGKPKNLIRNFNETQASSELSMTSFSVIPYIMDDKTAGNDIRQKTNMESLINEIMALSEGDVKRRYYDKEDKRFYCPVVMSTEESIAEAIADTSKKGAYYRFIEIECLGDLTRDGEHADKLERFMNRNYGVAGDVFAKYLIERYDTELLVEEYLDVIEEIRAKENSNHRAAKRQAVIIFTAKLINECFDLNIDTDKLFNMLEEQRVKAFEKSNRVLAELKRLHDYIENNSKYFKSFKKFKRNTCLGIYDDTSTKNVKQLIIEPAALNHIFNGGTPNEYFEFIKRTDGGEEQVDLNIISNLGRKITKAWKAKGYITSGGSHGKTRKNTSGRTIDKKQRQVYIIEFSELKNV